MSSFPSSSVSLPSISSFPPPNPSAPNRPTSRGPPQSLSYSSQPPFPPQPLYHLDDERHRIIRLNGDKPLEDLKPPLQSSNPQHIISHQPISRPPLQSGPKLLTFEYLEKIREEFQYLDMKLDAATREKNELFIHYAKHWEMAYQLNAEVHKQVDINSRYQAIINQLLPMLTPNVQSGVRQDMESIKTIADTALPAPPEAPHPFENRDDPNSPSGYMNPDLDPKRQRGRPSKARLEKLKEVNKRLKMDGTEMDSVSSTNSPGFRSTPVSGPGPLENLPQSGQQYPAAAYARPSTNLSPQAQTPPPGPMQLPRMGSMNTPSEALAKHAVPRGVNLAAVLPHGDVVCALALSHPLQHVFTGGRGVVKIWDVGNMRESRKGVNVGSLDCLDNYIRACHITRDSKTMIVAGEARYMVVCDIGSANPVITGRLQTPNQLTYALSASKDSRTAFSCCSDGSVNMWDLRSMSLVKTFDGHEDSVTCCCLTPDGQKLITGSLDKTVRVWDIAEGREHCKYDFSSQIFSLGVCPMEPIIAVGLETSVVDVRYLSNFDLNQQLTLHDSCVLGLKYSPSGSWFVTSGKDHKWIAWRSLNCETLFQQLEDASILSCDISRDGKYVVTGSGESNAHVYEVVY